MLHPTLHHADAVCVVGSREQFHLCGEDAVALPDTQLFHVVCSVRVLHGERDLVDVAIPHVLHRHVQAWYLFCTVDINLCAK